MTKPINKRDRIHLTMRAEAFKVQLEAMLVGIKDLINDLQPDDGVDLDLVPRRVIVAVAEACRVIPRDITGGRLFAKAVTARYATALALRELGLSYPQIGKALRQKEHATAIRAVARARDRLHLAEFSAAVAAGVAAGRVDLPAAPPAKVRTEPRRFVASWNRQTFTLKHGTAERWAFCNCSECEAARPEA